MWSNHNLRRSLTTNVNLVCCAASLGLVRVQAQRQHLKGWMCHCCGWLGDMWYSRVLFWRAGHPYRMRANLRVLCADRYHVEFLSLQPMFQPKPVDCSGGLAALRFFSTVVSLMISIKVNLYSRPRHTREGDRNPNPHSIVLGPIFRLQVRLALVYEPHRRSTDRLQDSLQFEV